MVTDVVKLQALLRVRLEQLGDEILRHSAEASRPLDPLMQNIVKEFLLVFTDKWRIARQKFEKQDAQIPNVQRLVMAALTNHLRSQILRRSTISHSFPILIEEVRPAEVCQLDGVLCVEQYILRLDIPMNNWRVLRVQVLDSLNDLTDELGCDAFAEATLALETRVDLALGCELQDQVEGVIILVVIEQFDHILVI